MAGSDSVAGRFRSTNVQIRALLPSDVASIHAEEVSEALAFRWRLAGGHPDPAEYPNSLWSGVLASFIAEDVRVGSSVALFTAYNADFRNQHVYVAGTLLSGAPSEPLRRALLATEALFLTLEYVFCGWPFRKVYLEVPEYNLEQFASLADRLAVEEGRLRAHVFAGWNWWDLVTLAVWRDQWESSRYRARIMED
jgi:RimJ/RimL family protein N-acetyltransferase